MASNYEPKRSLKLIEAIVEVTDVGVVVFVELVVLVVVVLVVVAATNVKSYVVKNGWSVLDTSNNIETIALVMVALNSDLNWIYIYKLLLIHAQFAFLGHIEFLLLYVQKDRETKTMLQCSLKYFSTIP